ncbi:MAG: Hsp20/alpha crystallin family protein [Chryseolinea sp.]
MKKSKYLELLTSVDVMNALNGGRVQPRVKLSQREDHREIRVRVPGVDSAGIEVEVNNDRVSIFYIMDVRSSGKVMHLPYSIYEKQQPFFVDVSRINAKVEGDELIVRLPFNELSDGYYKKIKSD